MPTLFSSAISRDAILRYRARVFSSGSHSQSDAIASRVVRYAPRFSIISAKSSRPFSLLICTASSSTCRLNDPNNRAVIFLRSATAVEQKPDPIAVNSEFKHKKYFAHDTGTITSATDCPKPLSSVIANLTFDGARLSRLLSTFNDFVSRQNLLTAALSSGETNSKNHARKSSAFIRTFRGALIGARSLWQMYLTEFSRRSTSNTSSAKLENSILLKDAIPSSSC